MPEKVDKSKQPFLYLIENIDKVDIDDVIKPTFIEVLKLLQDYFEKNDLIEARDYGKFFDKFLIGEGKTNIHLVPSSQTKRLDNYNPETKNIELIDFSKETGKEYKTDKHALLHEFIHFLVWRNPINGKQLDKYETFFDEGFTEKLTQEIMGIKRNDTYEDNINMVELINNVMGKKESYTMFLQGYSLNKELLNNNEKYAFDFFVLHNVKDLEKNNKPISHQERSQLRNELRLKSQRNLINSFPLKQCTNIQEFVEIVKGFSQRPFLDSEFMGQFYDKYKTQLLKSYKTNGEISNEEEKQVLEQLDKLVQTIESFDRYNCEELCKLTLGEASNSIEVFLDKEGNILRAEQYGRDEQRPWNGFDKYKKEYSYHFGRYNKKLTPEEFAKLDFTKAKKEYQNDMGELMEYFSQIEKTEKGLEGGNKEDINYNNWIDVNESLQFKHQIEQLYRDMADNGRKDTIQVIQDKTAEVFAKDLNGVSKELAELYAEIYTYEVDKSHGFVFEDKDMMFEKISKNMEKNYLDEYGEIADSSQFTEVIKTGDNSYIAVYSVFDENGKNEHQYGIPIERNPETGELETSGLYNEEKLNEKREIHKDSFNTEQMKDQIVKNNIEQTMKDGNVNELLEIKDEKLLEYLEEQNGWIRGEERSMRYGVYLASKQGKDGKNFYEFVAKDDKGEYRKLDGMEEVENKKKMIVEKDNVELSSHTNVYPTSEVDSQFVDKDGNSYFVYHSLETQTMSLDYQEKEKQTEGNIVEEHEQVEVKDSGLNKLLHDSRVRDLLKSGYEVMSIGIEKVKEVYNKFKEKTNEKENDVEKE